MSEIEEITTVRADTLVVLGENPGLGPWMISAGLRYAWERRASGLVVRQALITDTETALAQRLDVTLLAAVGDITSLAIDVATLLGMAKAGAMGRIQRLSDQLTQAATVDDALRLASDQLSGSSISLDSADGIMLVDAGTGDQTADQRQTRKLHPGKNVTGSSRKPGAPTAAARRSTDPRAVTGVNPTTSDARDGGKTTVSVHVHPGEPEGPRLTALSWPHEEQFTTRVLAATAPIVRALLAESNLAALRASLPAISVATLTAAGRTGFLDRPAVDNIPSFVRWPTQGQFIATCILAHDRRAVGTVVHQLWQQSFEHVPLARISDGWLAFVPINDGHSAAAVVDRTINGLGNVPDLRLQVGVSNVHTGADAAVDAVSEAWLAARLAGDSQRGQAGINQLSASGQGVLPFPEVPVHLLERLLPEDLAMQLAQAMLPNLLEDPSSRELIEAVVGYLAARGSVSGGAKLLGVHRNTLQARVRRAEELGVHLSDPQQVLPMFMLLSSLARNPQ